MALPEGRTEHEDLRWRHRRTKPNMMTYDGVTGGQNRVRWLAMALLESRTEYDDLRRRYRRADPSTMACDGVTGGQNHRCLLSSAERRRRGKLNHADGRAQRKNSSKWVSSVKENFVEKDYRWKKSQWITLKSSFSGLKFRISVRKLFKHCCTSFWLGEVRV